jgi:hypothetical protein
MWDGIDKESKRYNVLDAIWLRVGAKIALCLGKERDNSSVLWIFTQQMEHGR